ncbi:MAG TPA: flagellar basal body P-ring formation chaperone FlgA [Verrucomicrobiae bacterium]|jgi:flagella basal body P-ring formation protein FlgA|nr:flagellar basal body P-ring formation chaperone FlgA [Verrucomicrobiae bacterium]
MKTSNLEYPTTRAQCRANGVSIVCSLSGVRRWVFTGLFIYACLGGGVASRSVAGDVTPSDNTANVATTRALGESDVLALLTDSLQNDYVKDRGDLELRFTHPWAACNVPNEPLTVKILDAPSAGVTASFLIHFELRTADRSVGTWTVTLQAHVWREIWVAHSTLKRGQDVADADVVRERRDVLNIHDALADFVAGDPSVELSESVQSNAPLLARMIKARTVIRRGDAADAVVQDGALNISMKVEALEDGAPGDTIRARNPITHRDLSGKVLNDQTILISL